jgi:hypothetical protein
MKVQLQDSKFVAGLREKLKINPGFKLIDTYEAFW